MLIAAATLVPMPPAIGWRRGTFGACLFCGELGGLDTVNNVLLFLPFGAAAAGAGWRWHRIAVLAAGLSTSAELAQFAGLSGRYAGFGDIVFNTVGAVLGSVLLTNRHTWMTPSTQVARIGALVAAAGFVGVTATTSWMLGLAVPDSPLTAQWAPRRAVPFTGVLHHTTLNGDEVSSGPLDSRAEERFRSLARAGHSAIAADIAPARDSPRGFAPVFRIVTDERVHLALGQSRDAIVFIPTLRSRQVGFRTLAIRGPTITPASERLRASGSTEPRRLRVSVEMAPGQSRSAELDLTVGLAWATMLPVTVPIAEWHWLASAAWLLLLAIPLGFYATVADSSHRRARWRWIAPITLMCGLVVVPAFAGIALSGWTEWAGAVTGVILGGVTSARCRRARFVHRAMAKHMDGRTARQGEAIDTMDDPEAREVHRQGSTSRPLHVLQLGAVPPPYGGVQVNLMAIRGFLQRHGHRCSAINLTGNRQPDRDGLFFPRTGAAVLRLIVRLRPDILHLHIGGHLPWRLVALAGICSIWPGARTVLTFHSGGYPTSDEGRRLTSRSLKARVLQRFDRVIAVNDDIKSFLVRCGVREDRVRVVSPYASEPPYQGLLPERLERFLTAHSPVLVTIGLLEPEYDLELQIDVLGGLLQRYPRTGLLMLGSGSLERTLRERLDRTPFRDHVLLYGDLAHDVTLAVLRRAQVFLRTTRYDGDALSVREALALGVPVVATRTALRPAGPRLVDVGDRRGLDAAVRECLAEPDAVRHGRASTTLHPDREEDDTRNLTAVMRLYEDAVGVSERRSIREASPA